MSDEYSETTVDWRNLPAYKKPVITTPVTTTPAVSTPKKTVTPAPSGIQSMFSSVLKPAATPKPTAAPASPFVSTVPKLELPSLQLPEFKFSEGSSVTDQLNKLNSTDSLANQQALSVAREQGAATGGIRSSQFGGAAQRAISEGNLPLATLEANRIATQDTTNYASKTQQKVADFTNKTQQKLQEYEKNYTERINQLGYTAEKQAYMAQANTSLSNAYLAAITSITNNEDLDIGQEVVDRFTKIFNTAMDNNNLILDMNFKY